MSKRLRLLRVHVHSTCTGHVIETDLSNEQAYRQCPTMVLNTGPVSKKKVKVWVLSLESLSRLYTDFYTRDVVLSWQHHRHGSTHSFPANLLVIYTWSHRTALIRPLVHNTPKFYCVWKKMEDIKTYIHTYIPTERTNHSIAAHFVRGNYKQEKS